MKPAEKAKELHQRFINVQVPYNDCMGGETIDVDMDYASAKQCALICVEEIMKEVEFINEGVQSIDWLEVKSEIEKL